MAGGFTTQGRLALQVMADLASHEGWVSLGSVAERAGISRKYLEPVMAKLVRAGLVVSQRGKGGGYRLAKSAADYAVDAIFAAVEDGEAASDCIDCATTPECPRALDCPTKPLWQGLGALTSSYFASKTLADLVS